MSRMSNADAGRVRALCHELETLPEGAPSALATHADTLRALLDADVAGSYGVAMDAAGLSIDFAHVSRLDLSVIVSFGAFVREQPIWGLYDPMRPEPWQRNTALTGADLTRPGRRRFDEASIIQQEFYRRALGACDTLRVLVCDGPVLLAYVAGWRETPFTPRERQRLQAIAPSLERRLRLERELRDGELRAAALHATLEALAAPAFVVSDRVAIRHANRAGRALLDADRASVVEDLLAALHRRPGPRGFELTRLAVPGLGEHFLAVRRAPSPDLVPRLAAASARWTLTPRQGEVLGLLVRGHANKTIAAMLACTEGTVEVHVTALLAKAAVESRAALVARFFGEL